MRVVVPFTALADGVPEALDATGWAWTPVDVSHSTEAYWGLLAEYWARGEGFIVVEHDVLIQPDTFDQLSVCPEPWCAHPVPYFVGPYAGLGCVKFTDQLISRVPDLWDRVATMSDPTHPPRHYCRLDAWMQQVLAPVAQRHIHPQLLGHVRAYDGPPQPSHGCT